jgi:hypothetical protein
MFTPVYANTLSLALFLKEMMIFIYIYVFSGMNVPWVQKNEYENEKTTDM